MTLAPAPSPEPLGGVTLELTDGQHARVLTEPEYGVVILHVENESGDVSNVSLTGPDVTRLCAALENAALSLMLRRGATQ